MPECVFKPRQSGSRAHAPNHCTVLPEKILKQQMNVPAGKILKRVNGIDRPVSSECEQSLQSA